MKKIHGYKTKLDRIKDGEECRNCQYCDKCMADEHNLNRHLAAVHRNEVILHHSELLTQPCEKCEEMFQGVDDLDKHSKSVHNKPTKTYRCTICQETFESKAIILKHRYESHQEELQALGMATGAKEQCIYCEKVLKIDFMKKHIFSVHKDKRHLHPEIQGRFSCDECDEEFYDNSSRKLHMKVKHTQAMQCQICNKVYPNQRAMEIHTRTHLNSSETHICEVCSIELKTKEGLKLHLKKHRDGDKRKNYKYKCSQCNGHVGRFQTEEFLQKHTLKFHSGVQYICSQCPLSFNSPTLRNCHENVHKEKTIQCDECEKTFSGQYKLRAHKRNVHNIVVDQICPHCGEGFRSTNMESFRAHVNRHTNTRPYACELCGKDFLIEKHLKTHMLRHTKSISCDKCEDHFGSLTDLRAHKRKVHEGVQLTCRFGCSYQTWGSGNRNRHELACQLNPMPNAPYTIAVGTANNYIVQTYHAKVKDSPEKKPREEIRY